MFAIFQNMTFRLIHLSILAASMFTAQAVASTITLLDVSDGPMCPLLDNAKACVTILYEGNFSPGDATMLEERISRIAKLSGLPGRIGTVFLNSQGGDMYEAMKFAEVVRKHKIQTAVKLSDKCYSACVLALAGGVGRFPFGEVGVHSFYSTAMIKPGFDYEKEDARYRAVADDVSKFLVRMRIPTTVLDEMIKTPPAMLKILKEDEPQRFGLFGIDPLFHQLLVTKGVLKPKP